MTHFLNTISRDSKLLHLSQEPLDLDGSRPVPGVLTKAIEEVEDFAQRGPPISLSALVSSSPIEIYLCSSHVMIKPAFIDAAKNLSTVGINDRKFLVSGSFSIRA
jgi:hypothetical protein